MEKKRKHEKFITESDYIVKCNFSNHYTNNFAKSNIFFVEFLFQFIRNRPYCDVSCREAMYIITMFLADVRLICVSYSALPTNNKG